MVLPCPLGEDIGQEGGEQEDAGQEDGRQTGFACREDVDMKRVAYNKLVRDRIPEIIAVAR